MMNKENDEKEKCKFLRNFFINNNNSTQPTTRCMFDNMEYDKRYADGTTAAFGTILSASKFLILIIVQYHHGVLFLNNFMTK